MQGRFRRYIPYPMLLLFFLFLPVQALPSHAVNAEDEYIHSLLDLAWEQKLSENRYWHILLHYEKGFFGIESLIDDPDFFLSPEGKHDPLAELEAAIKKFFRRDVKQEDVQPCRFPARYEWLKEVLHIDRSQVPVFKCQEVENLNPKSALLVFPTYFMNSPASMFGHTLINIETDFSNKLLTKSVNYSARSNETNGLFFAVKGLFGFYEGYYSVLPYYMKIQQYSDISQRDIWEYRLNLTEPELLKMVRHIKELEEIHADYFFFDENCSYNLLYLLEAARPSADLISDFASWAIPIDTIRAVEKAGIIESVDFRPSKATKIKHIISQASEHDLSFALSIINNEKEPSSVLVLDKSRETKITIMDLVAGYTGYMYAKNKLAKKDYQKAYLSTLKVRSSLGKLESPHSPPKPPRPDLGHKSRRMDTGVGTDMDETFIELGFRPAFSDLLDTNFGSNQGAQIKFLNTTLRYYISDQKLVLDKIDFVDIISISPRDRFFKPLSWKAAAGVRREIMSDSNESPVLFLSTGAGLAYYNDIPGLFYAFVEPEFRYGTDLEKNFSLGGGISVGLIRDITDWWKCHLFARQIYFEMGDDHKYGLNISQNIVLSKNNHIRVDATREKRFNIYNDEAKITWCWFF